MRISRSALRLKVADRVVTVGGEAYLPGHGSHDFVVYTNTIEKWNDGTPIGMEEKREIVECVTAQAEAQGLRIEIE
jgi:hypothetical protein